ncbi:MAG: hypothetical protein JXR39_11405 [Marinilabiliaceae bacterium]|nr:hypothetical protein [Marinilabiliaceae bacterium]
MPTHDPVTVLDCTIDLLIAEAKTFGKADSMGIDPSDKLIYALKSDIIELFNSMIPQPVQTGHALSPQKSIQ